MTHTTLKTAIDLEPGTLNSAPVRSEMTLIARGTLRESATFGAPAKNVGGCADCKKSMEVRRDEHDYPEAVRVEVRCDKCDDGDFAEVMHYDADGKHITRDPSLPDNV